MRKFSCEKEKRARDRQQKSDETENETGRETGKEEGRGEKRREGRKRGEEANYYRKQGLASYSAEGSRLISIRIA